MSTTKDFQAYRQGFRDRKYNIAKDPDMARNEDYQSGWTNASIAIEDGYLKEENHAYLQ